MILHIQFESINEQLILDDDPSVVVKINTNPSITIKI